MSFNQSNYLVNPHWDTPRKKKSREDSVFEPYLQYFTPTIPPNTQYWTLCGAHFTGVAGQESAADGEFTQHLSEGLYEPHQFHGVDRDEHTIQMNRRFYPGVNWHCGDFLTTIKSMYAQGKFNPAIINYDSIHEPKRGCAYLRKLMHFIDLHISSPLMLCANVVLKNPRRSDLFTPDDVIETLEKGYDIPDHWTWHRGQIYAYNGGAAEGSRSLMGTVVFIKSAHERVVVSSRRNLAQFVTN